MPNEAPTANRVWLLWLSVVVQQSVLLLVFGLETPLFGVSEWVIYVPVLIIWGLYLVVPFLYPRRSPPHALLRGYATTGWAFVAAAIVWAVSYIVLSHLFGTPVSSDAIQQVQRRPGY